MLHPSGHKCLELPGQQLAPLWPGKEEGKEGPNICGGLPWVQHPAENSTSFISFLSGPNYPPITGDKAKLREVTGLAKVTQPLSGRADTPVPMHFPDAVTTLCHCVKTITPDTGPECLKLQVIPKPPPLPQKNLSWGHLCLQARLDFPAWLWPHRPWLSAPGAHGRSW